MVLLLPGYPADNAILEGIAAIAAGKDPEAALAARDSLLAKPFEFTSAALEAVTWLPMGSPLLSGLLAQATGAFNRADPDAQSVLLARASEMERVGHPEILAMTTLWRRRLGAQ